MPGGELTHHVFHLKTGTLGRTGRVMGSRVEASPLSSEAMPYSGHGSYHLTLGLLPSIPPAAYRAKVWSSLSETWLRSASAVTEQGFQGRCSTLWSKILLIQQTVKYIQVCGTFEQVTAANTLL